MRSSLKDETARALDELRNLARGLAPPILELEGLGPALRALARELPVATDVDVDGGRLAAVVESSVYFCCAEALQNAAKHSEARHISVWVRNEDDQLRLTIGDDGKGSPWRGLNGRAASVTWPTGSRRRVVGSGLNPRLAVRLSSRDVSGLSTCPTLGKPP